MAAEMTHRRGLQIVHRKNGRILLRLALVVALGLIVVQLLWYVGARAPAHPGGGYQPRDLERQRQLEDEAKR